MFQTSNGQHLAIIIKLCKIPAVFSSHQLVKGDVFCPRFCPSWLAGDLLGKWCVGTLSSWDGSSESCDKQLKISDRFLKGQEAKKHRISISK